MDAYIRGAHGDVLSLVIANDIVIKVHYSEYNEPYIMCWISGKNYYIPNILTIWEYVPPNMSKEDRESIQNFIERIQISRL